MIPNLHNFTKKSSGDAEGVTGLPLTPWSRWPGETMPELLLYSADELVSVAQRIGGRWIGTALTSAGAIGVGQQVLVDGRVGVVIRRSADPTATALVAVGSTCHEL